MLDAIEAGTSDFNCGDPARGWRAQIIMGINCLLLPAEGDACETRHSSCASVYRHTDPVRLLMFLSGRATKARILHAVGAAEMGQRARLLQK
jgi:hypothetical protein